MRVITRDRKTVGKQPYRYWSGMHLWGGGDHVAVMGEGTAGREIHRYKSHEWEVSSAHCSAEWGPEWLACSEREKRKAGARSDRESYTSGARCGAEWENCTQTHKEILKWNFLYIPPSRRMNNKHQRNWLTFPCICRVCSAHRLLAIRMEWFLNLLPSCTSSKASSHSTP